MSTALNQILSLVGNLDDSIMENTSRQRFRNFLRANITDVGQIRDYMEKCLGNKGIQYNRALQDLVNYLAQRSCIQKLKEFEPRISLIMRIYF